MICNKCHSGYLNPPATIPQVLGAASTRCEVCNTEYRFSNSLKVAIPLLTLLAEVVGLNVTRVAATLGTPITLVGYSIIIVSLVYAVATAVQNPLVPSGNNNIRHVANSAAVVTIIACFAYLVFFTR